MTQTGDPNSIVGQADVTEADLTQVATQLGSKRPWLVPALVAAAMLLALALTSSASRNEQLSVLLPMVFVGVMFTYFQRAFKGAWAKQALSDIGGPTTFRFDDYGFTSESTLRQHRLAWAALARSLETSQAFVVFTTPKTLLIVPKRAFTEVQVAAVSRLLLERIIAKPWAKTGRLGPRRVLLLWAVLVVSFLSIWYLLRVDDASRERPHRRRDPAEEPRR